MQFLCDEWLVDVATDYAGKCTLIAAALTMIERSLLPDGWPSSSRPEKGRRQDDDAHHADRGGHRPCGPAPRHGRPVKKNGARRCWVYFLSGVPYILWDNIERGSNLRARISSELHVCLLAPTASLESARRSRTAASTIHFFTGNNIAPKGDLASRSLHMRLDVDRPDPENRPFKHPDPIGWTENHRGEILRALYTILLGNPTLAAAAERAARRDSRPGGVWSVRQSSTPRSWSTKSSTFGNCSSSKRRTTKTRRRSPMCSRFW